MRGQTLLAGALHGVAGGAFIHAGFDLAWHAYLWSLVWITIALAFAVAVHQTEQERP